MPCEERGTSVKEEEPRRLRRPAIQLSRRVQRKKNLGNFDSAIKKKSEMGRGVKYSRRCWSARKSGTKGKGQDAKRPSSRFSERPGELVQQGRETPYYTQAHLRRVAN